ncbi:hypothetical protein C806_00374 [Lachnospiraceae bacterium 3-1]|nr:hypothetical protein C806_00374 [Lachnospiraceae bacterium 3-1]
MKKRKKWIGVLLGAVCLFQVNTVPVQAEEYWPEGPQIAGESAVVMEASTGTVLYENNSHQQSYPASITKIMTCFLAVENSGLDEEVTFSKNAIYKTAGGSSISRDVDEVMTLEECLYGLMLESANECGYAIAEHVGKDYEDFIRMMNDRAKELGCTDTHFNNPHGLPDEEHVTSAYDIALISRAALKNDIFRMIVNSKRHTIPPTNKHEEETYLVNHHKMLTNYQGDTQYLYDYCIGGKTGYTSVAGSTLATFAEKDGMTLICVVTREQAPNHYLDTRILFDYCFENFQLWNVAENEENYNQDIKENKIFENEESFVGLNKEGCIVLPKAAAFTDAVPEIVEINGSKDVIGNIQYVYAGRKVGGTDIEVTGAKVSEFKFRKAEQEKTEEGKEKKEEKVLKINVKYIAFGVLAVVLLIGIGFGIYYIADNFYLIKYKMECRKQQKISFKEIKFKKNKRHK